MEKLIIKIHFFKCQLLNTCVLKIFQAYKDFQNFGRDSSQSIGKYSYDSGLWLGPGPEPNLSVPDAPFYRPPTVEQISSTPRPITAVVSNEFLYFL